MYLFKKLILLVIKNLYFYFSVDFVLDQKGVPLLEAYDKWRNWADSKVCCDYALHVGVTYWNDSVAKEMEVLTKEKGMIVCNIASSPFDHTNNEEVPRLDLLQFGGHKLMRY